MRCTHCRPLTPRSRLRAPDLTSLTIGPRDVEATLARALALRIAGERFTLRLAVSDVRLVGFQRAAAAAWELPADEREAAFVRLARAEGVRNERGERIRHLAADLARARGYVACAALAETVLVSVDIARLHVSSKAVDPIALRDLPTELTAPEPSHTIPAAIARTADADAIVIWCGDAHVRSAALLLHGLKDFGMPLVVVADGGLPGTEGIATFVPLAQGPAALARARVAIAAHNDDPADAIALARLGLPLVIPSSSGAHEYLTGASMFRAWVERDIVPAVRRALASPTPAIDERVTAYVPAAAAPIDGPRVAIRRVVAFGEAPQQSTAQSLARQTYRAIVRDGEPDDAAYETTVENGAVIFPDHLARLVAAAERSGAARVASPALRGDGAGGYDLVPDGFVLTRRRGARVPFARVTVATGTTRQ